MQESLLGPRSTFVKALLLTAMCCGELSLMLWPVAPTQLSKRFNTEWGNLPEKGKVRCRIHDLRHAAFGALLERYSHIRMNAKRQVVESLL